MTDVTVSMAGLRRAIAACRVHLPDPKDDRLTRLSRLHVEVQPWGVVVQATNQVSAAMARVEMVDSSDGEVGWSFDLSPDEARQVLAVFRPAKVDGSEDPQAALSIRIGDPDVGVVLTDITGLFPGRSASFPRDGVDLAPYPEVGGVITAWLRSSRQPWARAGVIAPAVTEGTLLASFAAASRAYKEPLTVRTLHLDSGDRLVVECGPSFIGVLAARAVWPDLETEIKDRELEWLERFPPTTEEGV